MIPEEPNVYSQHWFEFFHIGIDQERTNREVEFVCQNLPLPDFRKVLDVCCGIGRHARALASRGYLITGIDRDTDAIGTARSRGGGPTYIVADTREYAPELGVFDAAIVMGQSFGHFDSVTNRDVLSRIGKSLRSNGRVILDLWNREFFRAHQGERELKTSKGAVRENKHVHGDRLFVLLDYPNGYQERFEWQLFTQEQMMSLAKSAGLDLLLSCADFEMAGSSSRTKSRLQFILERRG